MDLSIVIVSFNTERLLQRCLDAVYADTQSLMVEIFVVDNASTDGSPQIIAQRYPHVNLIANERNVGFAVANNQAIRQASGEFVLLLNPDAFVHPGAAGILLQFMRSRPQAGFCGALLLNEDGTVQPSARRFPTPARFLATRVRPLARLTAAEYGFDIHGRQTTPANPIPADWISGACLLVRSSAIEQVGLMDEGFFLYFEETDWCRRMHAAGWQGWLVPAARATHLLGASTDPDRDTAQPFDGSHPRYWLQSRRRYMRRHYGLTGMWFTEAVDMAGNTFDWLRLRCRSDAASRQRAAAARQALTCLRNPRRSHVKE
ncbi:MAG TPA: glycosyltransferase family 2 protein [Phycisphaerae bacterium]|nr:glycosyltransferase family 2 protein [Phycisphaerae bacterium]